MVENVKKSPNKRAVNLRSGVSIEITYNYRLMSAHIHPVISKYRVQPVQAATCRAEKMNPMCAVPSVASGGYNLWILIHGICRTYPVAKHKHKVLEKQNVRSIKSKHKKLSLLVLKMLLSAHRVEQLQQPECLFTFMATTGSHLRLNSAMTNKKPLFPFFMKYVFPIHV